ncbi:IS5 family transposase [Elizabethkingia anophelis]|uniref:IS5 family transposase n=1 Tax=Elizabethkingia anophelis TaxID=1117645 RepID=UPI000D032F7F|nr:IS5 family transposase [Elizabethkingia anophelis]MCL1689426.1 IS5 family transposase [Elizabethkingia anophelis]MDV4009442.1 IS5/IS1182 family transposase [Elizabethkingia anophelis]MYY46368.1 IS5 family transposase [Elizabethkingia anophelis]PRQ84110.1 IS5/IS1182 family transposase [Elizabethkingia anophelis]PRQ85010.1 IS5/IS1182 family transposase [Elizabethkingia anophelis]
MYNVLSKDIIEMEIVPYLPTPKRGRKTEVPLSEIVNCILYKLKTGIQWHLLPILHLFDDKTLHYKTIFGYYRKWCKENVWKTCWIGFLSRNKGKIDLSSGDLDGSHTIALRGGEEVGYQRRKKRKTTNTLYFTDRQGLPLAMSTPISGNHHDLYDIELHFDEIIDTLQNATISVDGIFMNADAGFDAENLRITCEQKGIIANIAQNKRNSEMDNELYFDEKLYKERYSIERTNAWMDSFRSLLNRFDTTLSSWIGFNYVAFITIACKKFKKSR